MEHKRKHEHTDIFNLKDQPLTQEERVLLARLKQEKEKSTWLDVFCPERSCEINEPSDLP